MITIPVPKFVVFYNGEQEQPEKYDMKLSDAFEKKTDNLELELVCKVYNINFGKNKELLERCRVLKEYMIFVDYVRKYHEEQGYDELEKAINKAIDRCIEEGVLANFLMENRAEVVKVTQLDYTFDRQITLERKDAKQEGKEEIAINMLMAQMPLEEIMKFTGLSIEKLQQLAKEMIIK